MAKKEIIFSRLIEENKDKIYRICCCYINNIEDRNDLYQEALLNIWKGYKSFRGDATFSTWIYRITVNTALYFLSKKRSIQKQTDEYASQLKSDNEQVDIDIQTEINLLHKCVSELPLLDMIIISLVLEEISSKEIAKITGLTDSNVRVRIHRAKEELKKLMKRGEL